jgi:hypothetical protein
MSDELNQPQTTYGEHVEAVAKKLPCFYVVAPKKFAVLFFATFGFYSLYWFYKNWSNYKLWTNEDIKPTVRAVLSAFFAYNLFNKINKALVSRNIAYRWNHMLLGIRYAEFWFAAIAAEFYIYVLKPELFGYLLFPSLVTYFPLARAQKAINMACGQGAGEGNAKLSDANMIWILLGAAVWAFSLFGIYAAWAGLLVK